MFLRVLLANYLALLKTQRAKSLLALDSKPSLPLKVSGRTTPILSLRFPSTKVTEETF